MNEQAAATLYLKLAWVSVAGCQLTKSYGTSRVAVEYHPLSNFLLTAHEFPLFLPTQGT